MKAAKQKGERKLLKIIALVIAGLLLLVLALVAFHHLYSIVEAKKYVKPGRMVATDSGEMHVYCEEGPEGSPTYVFLDAFGGGSAYYDFKVIWSPLAENASVITIDYLGYGMSDIPSTPRSLDNIVEEVNTALGGSGLPPPYSIVSHSLGGFYATGYAQKYPQNVKSLIMIDTTPPDVMVIDHGQMDIYHEMRPKYKFQQFTGLIRFFGDDMEMPGLDKEEVEAYTFYSHKMAFNDAIMDELEQSLKNAEQILDKQIPDTIPILMLISAKNEERSEGFGWGATWVAFHEKYLNQNPYSRLIMMDAEHYIYVEIPDEVVNRIEEFSQDITATSGNLE